MEDRVYFLTMEKVSIFHYLCYQDFLKAYFAAKKKDDRKFSHRFLSNKLGLSSSNFIMLVMQGKRKLTRSMSFKISRAFRLTPKEAEYLECMVEFSRAASNAEKDKYLSRMMELRKDKGISKLADHQYEYYSNWYNLVVRELAAGPEFGGDFDRLAKQVFPPITPGQARDSLELLLKLGLIKKKGNAYVRSTPLITTGPEVSSVAVANFHRTMARLASAALDTVLQTERDMTACTVNISPKGFNQIKEAIAECRARVLAIANKDADADRVYQANFHLFPVSRKNNGGGQ
jgi:uncharacterized protein (TIGR02147 family)